MNCGCFEHTIDTCCCSTPSLCCCQQSDTMTECINGMMDAYCEEINKCNISNQQYYNLVKKLSAVNCNEDIECIKEQMKMLFKNMELNTNRYLQIINEIDNINLLIETNSDKMSIQTSSNASTCGQCLMFTDTTKVHKFIVEEDINIIWVTMVGGGGSGGIGCINGVTYYSGSGGGAGTTIIHKPIKVHKGATLLIKVGKGGTANTNCDGQSSSITIMSNGGENIVKTNGGENIVEAPGGENGFPKVTNANIEPVTFIESVEPGSGGINILNLSFSGEDGDPGSISLPSQTVSNTGDGGNSSFFVGGNGGQNSFELGGRGGTSENLIGGDGQFGSGGGGSCPKNHIDMNSQLSGNGGDGFVKLNWQVSLNLI